MTDAVLAMELGAEGLGRAAEVRLCESGVGPGDEVGGDGVDVIGLVGEVRLEALRSAGDRVDELPKASGVLGGGVDGPVRLLAKAQLGDRGLELEPVGLRDNGWLLELAVGGEGVGADPVGEVDPEGFVIEVGDAVVAEEVGVARARRRGRLYVR